MKTRYVKHNRADNNTTVWAATAESAVQAFKIAAELGKQGFTITTEPKYTIDGAFLWYNVQGVRQWKTDEEVREARLKLLRAPCGTGVRL
jgi:ribonuclease HI